MVHFPLPWIYLLPSWLFPLLVASTNGLLGKQIFASLAAQLVLILGWCPFPWASTGLSRGNSHLLLCEAGLQGSPELAWFGSVTGPCWFWCWFWLLILMMSLARENHFFALLSQLGTFIRESLQWQAQWMGSPWSAWNSGTQLSILDPHVCAAWEGTDSFPCLRFFRCLVSITLNLTPPPGVPADL